MMLARLSTRQATDAAADLLRACAAGCASGDVLRAGVSRLSPDAAHDTTCDSTLSNLRSLGSLVGTDTAAPQPVHARHGVLPQQRRSSTASPQFQPSPVPGPATTGDRRRTVAVGLSGGVDSAVAALMLRQAGHDVVGERHLRTSQCQQSRCRMLTVLRQALTSAGVFMRNWDERDESADGCSAEDDHRVRAPQHLKEQGLMIQPAF